MSNLRVSRLICRTPDGIALLTCSMSILMCYRALQLCLSIVERRVSNITNILDACHGVACRGSWPIRGRRNALLIRYHVMIGNSKFELHNFRFSRLQRKGTTKRQSNAAPNSPFHHQAPSHILRHGIPETRSQFPPGGALSQRAAGCPAQQARFCISSRWHDAVNDTVQWLNGESGSSWG